MSEPKILVVYFSRSGNTRRVALEVARELGADIEEIGSLDERAGVVGYVRSCAEAFGGKAAAIRDPRHDPADYELVVIGTPVWVSSLASPVRAYLARLAPRVRDAAFIVTLGGMGAARVLRQLTHLAGKPPVATLVVREREVAAAAARAGAFAGQIRAQLRPAPAGLARGKTDRVTVAG